MEKLQRLQSYHHVIGADENLLASKYRSRSEATKRLTKITMVWYAECWFDRLKIPYRLGFGISEVTQSIQTNWTRFWTGQRLKKRISVAFHFRSNSHLNYHACNLYWSKYSICVNTMFNLQVPAPNLTQSNASRPRIETYKKVHKIEVFEQTITIFAPYFLVQQ